MEITIDKYYSTLVTEGKASIMVGTHTTREQAVKANAHREGLIIVMKGQELINTARAGFFRIFLEDADLTDILVEAADKANIPTEEGMTEGWEKLCQDTLNLDGLA